MWLKEIKICKIKRIVNRGTNKISDHEYAKTEKKNKTSKKARLISTL
jgi:hypothetical protein